ncbi:MAG: c-type cytochrome, partial [Burkholderiaceae bacterium]
MQLVRPHFLAVLLIMANVCQAQSKASVESGQALFRVKCGACHSVACNRQGPRLEGVFDRTAGGVADFQQYTAELKA